MRTGYGFAVDWWSMGALMFEMMTGFPPFEDKNVKLLNQKILKQKITLPDWLSSKAQSIIKSFLNRNASKRLGSSRGNMFEVGGVTAIKRNKFFQNINWKSLLAGQVPPPFLPTVRGDEDTSNFHDEFVAMDLPLSMSEGSSRSKLKSEGRVGKAKNEGDGQLVLSNGMFRGFSFVADRFDLGSGKWVTLEEEKEDGTLQLPSGFHVGPIIKAEKKKAKEGKKTDEKSKKGKPKKAKQKKAKKSCRTEA